MGTSKSYDQVKAILGKLDRSIDEARAKRLNADEHDHDQDNGREEETPRTFGRARPLRPGGDMRMAGG